VFFFISNFFFFFFSFLSSAAVEAAAAATSQHSAVPVRVTHLDGAIVRFVSAGSYHSACVTDVGELYTWGWGKDGRLGHGDAATRGTPARVTALTGVHVQHVSCGDMHTTAVAADGSVYAWGSPADGRLGIGSIPAPPQGARNPRDAIVPKSEAVLAPIRLPRGPFAAAGGDIVSVSAGGIVTVFVVRTAGAAAEGGVSAVSGGVAAASSASSAHANLTARAPGSAAAAAAGETSTSAAATATAAAATSAAAAATSTAASSILSASHAESASDRSAALTGEVGAIASLERRLAEAQRERDDAVARAAAHALPSTPLHQQHSQLQHGTTPVSETQVLERRLRESQNACAQSNAETQAFRNIVRKLEGQIMRMETEARDTAASRIDPGRLAALEQQLEASRAELGATHRELDAERGNVAALERDNAALRAKLELSEREVERLRRELPSMPIATTPQKQQSQSQAQSQAQAQAQSQAQQPSFMSPQGRSAAELAAQVERQRVEIVSLRDQLTFERNQASHLATPSKSSQVPSSPGTGGDVDRQVRGLREALADTREELTALRTSRARLVSELDAARAELHTSTDNRTGVLHAANEIVYARAAAVAAAVRDATGCVVAHGDARIAGSPQVMSASRTSPIRVSSPPMAASALVEIEAKLASIGSVGRNGVLLLRELERAVRAHAAHGHGHGRAQQAGAPGSPLWPGSAIAPHNKRRHGSPLGRAMGLDIDDDDDDEDIGNDSGVARARNGGRTGNYNINNNNNNINNNNDSDALVSEATFFGVTGGPRPADATAIPTAIPTEVPMTAAQNQHTQQLQQQIQKLQAQLQLQQTQQQHLAAPVQQFGDVAAQAEIARLRAALERHARRLADVETERAGVIDRAQRIIALQRKRISELSYGGSWRHAGDVAAIAGTGIDGGRSPSPGRDPFGGGSPMRGGGGAGGGGALVAAGGGAIGGGLGGGVGAAGAVDDLAAEPDVEWGRAAGFERYGVREKRVAAEKANLLKLRDVMTGALSRTMREREVARSDLSRIHDARDRKGGDTAEHREEALTIDELRARLTEALFDNALLAAEVAELERLDEDHLHHRGGPLGSPRRRAASGAVPPPHGTVPGEPQPLRLRAAISLARSLHAALLASLTKLRSLEEELSRRPREDPDALAPSKEIAKERDAVYEAARAALARAGSCVSDVVADARELREEVGDLERDVRNVADVSAAAVVEADERARGAMERMVDARDGYVGDFFFFSFFSFSFFFLFV
jgi:hypothetical protein